MRRIPPATLALTLVVVAVLALAVGSVRLDSATSDEPAHIASGLIKLSAGWLDFFREQPPLMNSLSALPLYVAGYRVAPGWEGGNHWIVGRGFLYRSGFDAYRILLLARLPTIALFAVLVAAVFWFVARESGSAWWGVAAAVLTGFCPNLMAHGRLATVDMALAVFAFLSTAALLVLIKRPSVPLAVVFGITAAAAPMSKVSGLILGPYFAAVIAAAFLMRRISQPRRFAQALGVAVASAILFFTLFGLAITGSDYARSHYPELPRVAVPFAEYAANVRAISGWYSQGHALPQFLMGEFSASGWPHYYLVAFLLKTPIPAILLFITAVVVAARRRSFALVALFGFVALFLAVAASGHLALGIRYVLPIYPFIFAATAIALARAELPRAGVAAVVLLVAWHAAENLRAYPSYIAYFNQLIGSHRNADAFLIDSNLDWGQDLRRLNQWVADEGVDEITVHYFGGGALEYEMRAAPTRRWVRPGPEPLPPGWFALSRHMYRVSFHPQLWGTNYDEYLEASGARFVTSIGGSIDVYRVGR